MSAVSTGVFEPGDVEAMSSAYADVCRALQTDGDAKARETIASIVMRLARRGECSQRGLRDRVLAEANASALRAGSSPRCSAVNAMLKPSLANQPLPANFVVVPVLTRPQLDSKASVAGEARSNEGESDADLDLFIRQLNALATPPFGVPELVHR